MLLIFLVLLMAVPIVLTLGAAKNVAIGREARYFEDAEQMLALGGRMRSHGGKLVRTSH